MPCRKGTRGAIDAARSRKRAGGTDDQVRLFDVRTNAEWRQLGFTAESIVTPKIEVEKVPTRFRPLVPYAQRWAIGCDVRRGDYFEKQSRAEIDDFYRAVTPFLDDLNRWVLEPPLEEPKLTFLSMLKAYSEAVPAPSKPCGVIFGKKK